LDEAEGPKKVSGSAKGGETGRSPKLREPQKHGDGNAESQSHPYKRRSKNRRTKRAKSPREFSVVENCVSRKKKSDRKYLMGRNGKARKLRGGQRTGVYLQNSGGGGWARGSRVCEKGVPGLKTAMSG